MMSTPLTLDHLTAATIPQLRRDAAGQLVVAASSSLAPPRRPLPLAAIAHLKATVYWLHDYQPDGTTNRLDHVRGYLEAFHHLCELSAWNLAYALLQVPIRPLATTHTPLPLHQQLEIWGYYQELSESLRSLLGNLDPDAECFCLTRLGRLFGLRGCLDQGVAYVQQAIELATQHHNLIAKAQAHLELIDLYDGSEQYGISMQQGEIALALAQQLQHASLQAQTFAKLSAMLVASQSSQAEIRKALAYAQSGLALAKDLGDRSLECDILGHLGGIYFRLGQSHKAIHYNQQQLELAQEINHLRKQWAALTNWSAQCYLEKRFTQGRLLMEEALSVAQQMQDIYCETFIWSNLVGVGIGVADCRYFKPYLLQSLTRAHQTGAVDQEWVLWQCLAAIALNEDLATATVAIQAAKRLMPQIKPNSAGLYPSDLLNFSYLLCRLGLWQSGLHYAQRGLVIARRNQFYYGELYYRLAIMYAYWQGKHYLKSLGLFLYYLPQNLWLASQNTQFRYTFSVGLQIFTQPILNLWQGLLRLLRLAAKQQYPDAERTNGTKQHKAHER